MSSRELLKAIGEIDDRFIDEAAEAFSAAKPAARRVRRRGWVAAAACLAVAVGVGVVSLPGLLGSASKASDTNMAPERNYASESYSTGNASSVKSPEGNGQTQLSSEAIHEDAFDVIDAGLPDLSAEDLASMLEEDAVRALWHITVNGR